MYRNRSSRLRLISTCTALYTLIAPASDIGAARASIARRSSTTSSRYAAEPATNTAGSLHDAIARSKYFPSPPGPRADRKSAAAPSASQSPTAYFGGDGEADTIEPNNHILSLPFVLIVRRRELAAVSPGVRDVLAVGPRRPLWRRRAGRGGPGDHERGALRAERLRRKKRKEEETRARAEARLRGRAAGAEEGPDDENIISTIHEIKKSLVLDEASDDSDDDSSAGEAAGEAAGAAMRAELDEHPALRQQSLSGERAGADARAGGAANGGAPDELTPLDIDYNLVKNLLDSVIAEEGLPGPASSLMRSLGMDLEPEGSPAR